MDTMALVIQNFVKSDTLEGACDSLIECTGVQDIDLILWSDSPIGNKLENRFTPLYTEVQDYLSSFIAEHGHRFKSVTRSGNHLNQGCYKTCQLALDYAFSLYPFVVFAEDDVVFARDALQWFDLVRRQSMFADESVWAVAGESIFFNARTLSIDSDRVEATKRLAMAEGLHHFYITHKFIPSTCFATSRSKWQEFGQARGRPIGDVEVCNRCEKEGRVAIFPIVPRVKDVGMLHDNGYSVLIHSKDGVTESKNTYVMSDDLLASGESGPPGLSLYTGNAGRLYTLTTLMNGQIDAPA